MEAWITLAFERASDGVILIPRFILSALVLALFTCYYMQRQRSHFADALFGAQLGCQPMRVKFPCKWPFGLDVLKAQYDANAEQRLLAFQTPYVEKLGPNMELKLLGSTGYLTFDPENIEAILSSRFEDFGLGARRGALHSFVGEGIFTQDGPAWKHSRELLRRPFLKTQYQNLQGFIEPVNDILESLSASSGIVDLQPFFFRFTLATTTGLIFGQPVETLEDEKHTTFASSFDYASMVSSLRIRLQDVFWVYNPPEYKAACRRVRDYASGFVERALEDKNNETSTDSDRYAFIQDLYEELGDPTLVRDQLVNVLLAGRDTTACLLTWTFFLLVRHPTALYRLRNEIRFVIGDEEQMTRAHVQKLSYLKCVLNETLRLYPSVPVNARTATRTTWIPRGGGPDGKSPVLIPCGSGVGYIVYYMHRRKDLYGEDAADFRPERWEGPELANIGWGYLPFHGGPRLCLGSELFPVLAATSNADLHLAEDFALTEASFAIVRIIQTFPNIRLPPDSEVVPTGQEKQALSVFLSSADGCKVLLH